MDTSMYIYISYWFFDFIVLLSLSLLVGHMSFVLCTLLTFVILCDYSTLCYLV